MDTIAAAAKKLGKCLATDFREIFGSVRNDEAEQLGALGRITIECIVRSNAVLPHLRIDDAGDHRRRRYPPRRTLSNRIEPSDYIHRIVACLLHAIGLVRGVLSGDTKTEFE